MYYLQSRYYDPVVDRFVNADSYTSTGQGLLGHNTYSYCKNNPVNCLDTHGDSVIGITLIAGGIVSLVSGVANAVSTAVNGGSVEDCVVAGLVGFAGGAIGFGIAWATGFSVQGAVAGRAVGSALTDLGTTAAVNGKITLTDVASTAWDVVMDSCFSTIGYYYTNPITGFIKNNFINSAIDGFTDISETYLFGSKPDNKTSNLPKNLKPKTSNKPQSSRYFSRQFGRSILEYDRLLF